MEELPKLYTLRIDYIKPCVNSLIGSQAKFYEDYSKFYETILNEPQQQPEDTRISNVSINGSGGASQDRDYVNIMSSGSAGVTAEFEVENLNNEIQQCLKDIKSLSIVASD